MRVFVFDSLILNIRMNNISILYQMVVLEDVENSIRFTNHY